MATLKMSKIIGLIAEDNSDIEVIANILGKYIDRSRFSIKKFVGNGCGKLKQKCDSWTDNLIRAGCQHVFIFHDLDRNNATKLRRDLEKKVPKDKYPNSLIIIPIEELEAWLLCDESALAAVFALNKIPKKIENCDEVQNPKEHLRDLIWELGKKRYLNTVHNKQISEKVSLLNLRRCNSYHEFDKYIKEKIFRTSTA